MSFQNKLIFPAPENSYTSESSMHQVIYIPRNILDISKRLEACEYPSIRQLSELYINSHY